MLHTDSFLYKRMKAIHFTLKIRLIIQIADDVPRHSSLPACWSETNRIKPRANPEYGEFAHFFAVSLR
jgi:hypothetical protein